MKKQTKSNHTIDLQAFNQIIMIEIQAFKQIIMRKIWHRINYMIDKLIININNKINTSNNNNKINSNNNINKISFNKIKITFNRNSKIIHNN